MELCLFFCELSFTTSTLLTYWNVHQSETFTWEYLLIEYHFWHNMWSWRKKRKTWEVFLLMETYSTIIQKCYSFELLVILRIWKGVSNVVVKLKMLIYFIKVDVFIFVIESSFHKAALCGLRARNPIEKCVYTFRWLFEVLTEMTIKATGIL